MTLLAGQKVTAAELNLITSRVMVRYVPSGNIDSLDTFLTWLTSAAFTVPTGAVSADLTVSVAGWFDTTGDNDYLLRAAIGTDDGAATVRVKPASATSRGQVTWEDRIALTSTGSKSLIIKGDKLAGTGVFRADTSSLLSARIDFL